MKRAFAAVVMLALGFSAAPARAIDATGTESATVASRKWFFDLPNTVSFDLSNDRTDVTLDGREKLHGVGRPIPNGLGQAAQFAGHIGLTTLGPSLSAKPRFAFRWVPAFTFAFQNVGFDSPLLFLANTDFQMFRTSFGFGPEASVTSKIGAFYISVMPGVAYNWVSWSSPVSGGSMSHSGANVAASAGYHREISNHWAMRAFARYVLEDTSVWKQALSSSQGFEVPVERVETSIVGLSLCFLFGAGGH